jgi:hypothetical protein
MLDPLRLRDYRHPFSRGSGTTGHHSEEPLRLDDIWAGRGHHSMWTHLHVNSHFDVEGTSVDHPGYHDLLTNLLYHHGHPPNLLQKGCVVRKRIQI